MLVIGIAGGSGSGKSTFVRRIIEKYPSDQYVVIPQDNYYKDHSPLPLEVRKEQNFDHPDSIEFDLLIEHLTQLKNGNSIEIPTYSHANFARLKETITIQPQKVIIVEGIMVLTNAKLLPLLDMKFYVDAKDDDRFIRCVQRDIEERGRTFAGVLERYYKTVQPMHLEFIEPSKKMADLIIPRGGENKVAIDLIASRIKMELISE